MLLLRSPQVYQLSSLEIPIPHLHNEESTSLILYMTIFER